MESSFSDENNQMKKAKVKALYNALDKGDNSSSIISAGLIADDLEWWFHGPQNCQHMMKMLTGESSPTTTTFRFQPRSIDIVDDRVIVEGWEGAKAYWVHVWTVKDGKITQFREYFNTWLTVTDFRPLPLAGCVKSTLWQSHPRDLAKRSLPGLMLAI